MSMSAPGPLKISPAPRAAWPDSREIRDPTGTSLARAGGFGKDRVFSNPGIQRSAMAKRIKKRAGSRVSAKEPVRPLQNFALENVLGYNLRRAHGVQRQRFAAVFAPHSIRPVQLSVLGLILDNPRLKQADLGRALDMKRANIVTLL